MKLTEGRRALLRISGAMFFGTLVMELLAGLMQELPGIPGDVTLQSLIVRGLPLLVLPGLFLGRRIPSAIGFGLCALIVGIQAVPEVIWYLTRSGGNSRAAVVRWLLEALMPFVGLVLCAIACWPGRRHKGTIPGCLAAVILTLMFFYELTGGFRWNPVRALENWGAVTTQWFRYGQVGLMQQSLLELIGHFFTAAGGIFLVTAVSGTYREPVSAEEPEQSYEEASRKTMDLIAAAAEHFPDPEPKEPPEKELLLPEIPELPKESEPSEAPTEPEIQKFI